MNKVVYNACYGGFSISREAATRLIVLKPELTEEQQSDLLGWGNTDYVGISRHDKDLVYVVESMKLKGLDPSGDYAELAVATVGTKYRVCEYDGSEWVETPDSIEWTVIE